MLSNNAALHFQFAVQPIDITPAKTECFTDAKAKADAHQSNGPKWLSQMLNELLELFRRQVARLSLRLLAPLIVTSVMGFRALETSPRHIAYSHNLPLSPL